MAWRHKKTDKLVVQFYVPRNSKVCPDATRKLTRICVQYFWGVQALFVNKALIINTVMSQKNQTFKTFTSLGACILISLRNIRVIIDHSWLLHSDFTCKIFLRFDCSKYAPKWQIFNCFEQRDVTSQIKMFDTILTLGIKKCRAKTQLYFLCMLGHPKLNSVRLYMSVYHDLNSITL